MEKKNGTISSHQIRVDDIFDKTKGAWNSYTANISKQHLQKEHPRMKVGAKTNQNISSLILTVSQFLSKNDKTKSKLHANFNKISHKRKMWGGAYLHFTL